MKRSELYRGCTITVQVKPFINEQVWMKTDIVPVTDEAKAAMGSPIDGGKGDIMDLHVKNSPDPLGAASADAIQQAMQEIDRIWPRETLSGPASSA